MKKGREVKETTSDPWGAWVVECTNPKCGYEWVARVMEPKKCPKCGHWIKRDKQDSGNGSGKSNIGGSSA